MDGRVFFWPPPREIAGAFVGVILERLTASSVHVGFIYRIDDSNSYVLHLWGHRRLLHEPPRESQLCILCQIEPVRLPSIAAFARRLYRKNKGQGIPYAFSSPEQDWFSPDGLLLLGPGRLGLTCGNFVLALYRAAGMPLVQLDTWRVRHDDAAWQESILDEWAPAIARKDHDTQKHFEEVRDEIGTVRCRPIEIGGAARASEFPCNFDTALRHSIDLERTLSEQQ
jgi:hypothetical protein